MKVIPLSEVEAHLSRYARVCHDKPVVVTVNGVPDYGSVSAEMRGFAHHSAEVTT